MSRSSSVPPAATKTELETVVNWPLLLIAASAAVVLLTVPLVLACIAALKGHAVKDPVASLPAMTQQHSEKDAPITTSARASLAATVKQEAAENTLPRQVYIKNAPPIPPDPTPIPKVAKGPPPQPPALNPILQVREEKGPRFKRFDESSQEYLTYRLAKIAKEVDLGCARGTREKLLAEARKTDKDKEGKKPAILALCAERSDLKGLPMREGADCKAPREAVRKMQEISRTLRRELDRAAVRSSFSGQQISQRAELLQERLQSCEEWFHDEGLSTLAQMLQVEDVSLRGEFIKHVSKVNTAKSSVLLARFALFDPSWPVREQAITALRDRSRREYRQVLLGGLRYPWPPVSAHAAEALVAVEDREAVAPLADMLDEPDPCAPVRDKNNQWSVAEVVRINHLRNCLLCHAPSTDRKDPLRGVVPTPGEPLPVTRYYDSGKGDFVRADVTYLRQDFSVIEHVPQAEKWPEWQRFDYLARRRELTAEELAAYKNKPRSKTQRSSYPQRKAVLFALRELTGLDAGETSADWYELLCSLAVPAPH